MGLDVECNLGATDFAFACYGTKHRGQVHHLRNSSFFSAVKRAAVVAVGDFCDAQGRRSFDCSVEQTFRVLDAIDAAVVTQFQLPGALALQAGSKLCLTAATNLAVAEQGGSGLAQQGQFHFITDPAGAVFLNKSEGVGARLIGADLSGSTLRVGKTQAICRFPVNGGAGSANSSL